MGIKAQTMRADQYIDTTGITMMASMGGWIQIIIWRTGTWKQWHSHRMQYHNNWCFVESVGVHICMDSMTKS